MECKYHTVRGQNCRIMELIDTLWNVNESEEMPEWAKKLELIDTLWNVNADRVIYLTLRLFELIDTLWNVNLR